MPENSEFLYLKEEGVPWNDLENMVQRAVEEKGYRFRSQNIQITTDTNANVIFYVAFNPIDPAIGQSQITGLLKKRPNNPLVVVCEQSREKAVRTLFNSEHLYTLPRNSSPQNVGDLINQIEANYFNEPEQPPKALILAEKNPQVLRKELEGFDIMSLVGRKIKPEELGQFEAHKTKFDLVLIEGKHIGVLADDVFRRFPDTQVVAIGTESDRSSASNKNITVFWIREEAPALLKRFANDHIQPVEASPAAKPGKCYLLAGPTCSGKTEAGYRMKTDPNIVFIQKYTTRPRRPDEIKGTDFQFISKERFAKMERDGKFFHSFKIAGNRYGIPISLEQILKQGRDVLVTLTADVLQGIKEKLNKINPDTAVPILFYADLVTLQERLLNRKASITEQQSRMGALRTSLKSFMDNSDLYKYALNTTYSNKDETPRLLRAIIDWERKTEDRDYVRDVLHSIFPNDLLKKIARAEEITMTIPTEVMFKYAEMRHKSQSRISFLQRQKVVCHSDSYGRLGIFLEAWPKGDENDDLDCRDVTLDLIQMAIGSEPRARNDHRYFIPLSIFGKCHDSLTAFNDGLLYMLGDDIRKREASDSMYAVAIGYAKTSGKFHRAKRLHENDMNFWQAFNEKIQRFPFRPFDNIRP